MRAPVVSDEMLPLDGILLYQTMRERYGPRETNFPGAMPEGDEKDGVKLPLACCETGSANWYYACSFAQWLQATAFGKDYWSKRVALHRSDIVDMGRASKVTISKGRYRSYHMPVFYRAALCVNWYAVGDLERIRSLLKGVWAIGKKQSQGWGRVARWDCVPWPEDWSIKCKGRWMRAVPVKDSFDASAVRLAGFRPPYWLRENQTLCEMPNGTMA